MDEYLAATRRRRRIGLLAFALVGAGIGWWIWSLPANAGDIDRLPADIDAVMVVDLDALEGRVLWDRRFGERDWGWAEQWKEAGLDPDALERITVGVMAFGTTLHQAQIFYGEALDTSKLEAYAKALSLPRRAIAVLGEHTFVTGHQGLVDAIEAGRSTVRDNDALMSVIRSAATSGAAWGAALYDDDLDRVISAKGALPSVEWGFPEITMRWKYTDHQVVRYELTFDSAELADKVAGRLMTSGSFGGVVHLFPALRTRTQGKTNVNGDLIPLEIEWTDELPFRFSVLELDP